MTENQNYAIFDLPLLLKRSKYLEHFMAVFIDLWPLTYSPLNSAKLNCPSEVTLTEQRGWYYNFLLV